MAHQQAEIMLVKADTLATHPLAFQKYIENFFELTNIEGVSYYFAFRGLNGDRSRNKKQKGVAPCHAAHLAVLVNQQKRLYDWLSEKCRDPKQSDIISLSKTWDDGCLDFSDVYD